MTRDNDAQEETSGSARARYEKSGILPLTQMQQELEEMSQNFHELEKRMGQLETSMTEAIETVYTRMETLVKQSAEHLPLRSSSASNSTVPSTAFSSGTSSQSPSTTQRSPSVFTFSPPHSPSVSIPNRLSVLSQSPPALFSSTAVSSPSSSPPESPTDRRIVLGRMLMRAVNKGCAGGVRLLLHSGADVNFPIDGWTPLHCAADCARAEILSLLLERGADVSVKNPAACSALHFAAWRDGSGRCMSSLVAAGADVHCEDADSNTPLHWAARWGNEAAARELLAAGARKDVENHDGKTPFFYAAGEEIRRLLHP